MHSLNISTTSTSIITNGSEGDITNVISEDQHNDDVIVENDLSIVDEKNKCYIILKDMNNDNNIIIYNNNIDNDKNHTDNNVNSIENNLIINNINNDNTNNNIITLGNKNLNLEYLQSLLSYNIYYILILNNITTRGTIVIYETQVSRILLDDYNLSIIDLGIIVSISGLVGTIQLIYFKELYTNNFRDIFLVISFSFIIAVAQLFILNWIKKYSYSIMGILYISESCLLFRVSKLIIYYFIVIDRFVQFRISDRNRFSVFFFVFYRFPIANTANLGLFSYSLKYGRQGASQGKFAMSASIARIIFPILSGALEQYVYSNTSFSIVLIMIVCSIIGTLLYYSPLLLYANRCIDLIYQTPNAKVALFDNISYRIFTCIIAVILLIIGIFSLIIVSS